MMMVIVIKGDEFYRKRDTLKKVNTDSKNWKVYYVDETSGEKWEEEYPSSEEHGGGEPILRKLNKFPWE